MLSEKMVAILFWPQCVNAIPRQTASESAGDLSIKSQPRSSGSTSQPNVYTPAARKWLAMEIDDLNADVYCWDGLVHGNQ